MSFFDIVVPTYNNKPALKRCLESLLVQSFQDFTIWVCDDASSDDTVSFVELLCTQDGRINLLRHPDGINKGRATNRNQAVAHLSAPYTVLIDGDTYCHHHLLEAYESFFKKWPNAVAIGHAQWTNKESNLWAAYICTRGVSKLKGGEQAPYQYFTSQNVAMPTKYFTGVGGFDTRFKIYGGEDTELAYRLEKLFGAKFYFNKEALIYTDSDKSLGEALDLLEQFAHQNLSYIAHKHPSCNEIFYLGLLRGHSLRARVFKILMCWPLYELCIKGATVLPRRMAIWLIKYCVAFRIYVGYTQKSISV